jgi:hypothetical protein
LPQKKKRFFEKMSKHFDSYKTTNGKGAWVMRNEEMLLIPGPTPVVDSIYNAMGLEMRGHTEGVKINGIWRFITSGII